MQTDTVPVGGRTPVKLENLEAMPLHERVQALRTIHRYTQRSLARELGVHRASVMSWETHPELEGSFFPSAKYRAALALLFGVPSFVFTPDWGAEARDLPLPDSPPLKDPQDPPETQEEEAEDPLAQESQELETDGGWDQPPQGVMRI